MRSVLFILVGLLAGVAPWSARAADIVDRADFFSETGEKQAAELLDQLSRKHRVHVHVETFESVPADKAERVKGLAARERGEFFADWLKTLAKESKADGIFVLICREPAHMRMGVSKELHQRGFSDSDRDAALKPLIAAFKEKEYDRGLVGALEVIGDKAGHLKTSAGIPVGSHAKSTTTATTTKPAAASPFSGVTGWICLGVGALVVVMLLVSVVGAFMRGGSGGGTMAPGGYGGGYGGGGGGIFSSILGGFGGAMLGNYIYDQFAGRSAHAGYPDQSPTDSGGRDDGYDDFSSGGGDFGDSGGGDFGGGGDGGGDF